MNLIQIYRRLDALGQARRLRLPFALLAGALTVAVVLLGTWMLDNHTGGPTTWGLIGIVVGALAASTLIKHFVWRVQRQVDGSR